MTDLFPTDPKRIRERIRSYELVLKRELQAEHGRDGCVKWFLLRLPYILALRQRKLGNHRRVIGFRELGIRSKCPRFIRQRLVVDFRVIEETKE